MKNTHLNAMLFFFIVALTACSGSKTEFVDYGPDNNTPALDMKASIYQAALPSGILTITSDQSGNDTYGAYTIKKNDGTIISTGKISYFNNKIEFTNDFNSPCINESMTAVPSEITATNAKLTFSGFGCTESITGKTIATTAVVINKVNPSPSMKLISQGFTNTDDKIQIEVASADDVNFVGPITFTNAAQSTSSTGTIVGTIKDRFQVDPVAKNINNQNAVGFSFDRVTNYSGNFFTDSLAKISGQARTAAATPAGPFYISEFSLTAANSDGSTTLLGPISSPTTLQSYTLQ